LGEFVQVVITSCCYSIFKSLLQHFEELDSEQFKECYFLNDPLESNQSMWIRERVDEHGKRSLTGKVIEEKDDREIIYAEIKDEKIPKDKISESTTQKILMVRRITLKKTSHLRIYMDIAKEENSNQFFLVGVVHISSFLNGINDLKTFIQDIPKEQLDGIIHPTASKIKFILGHNEKEPPKCFSFDPYLQLGNIYF